MSARKRRRTRAFTLGADEIRHLLWGDCKRPGGCTLCAVAPDGERILDTRLAAVVWRAHGDALVADRWRSRVPCFAAWWFDGEDGEPELTQVPMSRAELALSAELGDRYVVLLHHCVVCPAP